MPLQKARTFLKEVQIELRKVSWPPRKETVASTWVVLAVVVLFSGYFFFVDQIISYLVRTVLTL